jgi:hypothetical protein
MLKHPSFSGSQTRKVRLFRFAALAFVLLFFNYSALSSYNCQSFCNLNKLYDDAYSEMLILEDDSGASVAIYDSFCEVDTGSEDDSDDDSCEQCAYCHACSIGMTFQHIPPLLLEQAIVANKKIFNQGRSFFNKQIHLNHPQRGPPAIIRFFC